MAKESQNLLGYWGNGHKSPEEKMNEPLILFVEDLIAVRQELAEGLTEEGFEVIEAESVQSATDWLNDHTPDVVILDISLPDGTGFEIAERLRKRNIPFCFLTSHEETDIRQQIIANGDMYHVKSPDLTPARLAPNLHSLIRKMDGHLTDIARIKANQPIDKAIGIIAERNGISNKEAFNLLKTQARSQNRTILELAAEVVRERDAASQSNGCA